MDSSIDRKDLDTQTTQAFQSYANNDVVDVDETDNVGDLIDKLKNNNQQVVVTTIQKLSIAVKKRLKEGTPAYNAKQLAEFLDTCDGISVNYPALPSSPYYGITQRDLGGKGGAILTIRAGSRERAFKLINALSYAYIATNIGDVRTLVIHPASTIYTHNTEAQQISAGVYNDTICISVGIEDIADLISDFKQAIDKL